MYVERFDERHETGLVRLTGGNRGLVYCNERQEEVEVPATEEGAEPVKKMQWAYDVYEVDDARSKGSAKNSVVTEVHPFGDETKILRKTLAKVLKASKKYDAEDFAEFKEYNEFCESLAVEPAQ